MFEGPTAITRDTVGIRIAAKTDEETNGSADLKILDFPVDPPASSRTIMNQRRSTDDRSGRQILRMRTPGICGKIFVSTPDVPAAGPRDCRRVGRGFEVRHREFPTATARGARFTGFCARKQKRGKRFRRRGRCIVRTLLLPLRSIRFSSYTLADDRENLSRGHGRPLSR